MKLKAKIGATLAALALTCSCGICAASNFTVTDAQPNAVFFYMDKTEQTFYKPNAYHVLFSVAKGSNKLYIGHGKSRKNFMTLQPYENTYVSYDVKELPVRETNSGLFAISATAGAHAQNLGYWLVGVSNGKWRVLVDYNKLSDVGFNPDEWNRVYGEYDGYHEGFAITATTEYMPPWGKISADLIDWPKGKWICKWNDNVQAMTLKSVEVQRPAFIASQDQAMVYMDQWLRNHAHFKKYMQAGTLSYSRHNPLTGDGLENHEIKIIEDHPTHITTVATFIINECADIQFYDVVQDKYIKLQ